jgi:hypothetical protein
MMSIFEILMIILNLLALLALGTCSAVLAMYPLHL